MVLFDVGRLHARYDTADPGAVAALDDALRRVATEDLAAELVAHRLPTAHAVCLRRLDVPVALDARRPVVSLARAWSVAIVGALEQRLADGGDVVVYPREVDLLIDVVRSVAAGNRSRQWAWEQCGVVPATVGWPGPRDLAAVLAGRPDLIPATVAATRRALERAVDGPGWVALGRAVRARSAPAGVSTAGPVVAAGGVPAQVVAAAARVVPPTGWRAARGSDDRHALAVLGLACVAPARCRHRATVEQVADVGGGAVPPTAPARGTAPAPDLGRGAEAGPARGRQGPAAAGAGDRRAGPAGTSDGSRSPTVAGARSPGTAGADDAGGEPVPADRSGTDPAGAGDEAAQPVWLDPSAGPDGDEPTTTRHGGVLFLIHAVTALDLPTDLVAGPLAGRPPAGSLALVLAAASGVAVDDPAVLAAGGWRLDQPADGLADPEALAQPLTGPEAGEVAALADRLVAWVAGRLGEPADADLRWVWDRPATIDAQPGWTEATFALDDVDVRIRVAGLDLDPGPVWWHGGVVRFRYA